MQSVSVPESAITLQVGELSRLHSDINPLQESDNYGIDLYLSAIEFLRTLGYTRFLKCGINLCLSSIILAY